MSAFEHVITTIEELREIVKAALAILVDGHR
jgi:hypothetical protein